MVRVVTERMLIIFEKKKEIRQEKLYIVPEL